MESEQSSPIDRDTPPSGGADFMPEAARENRRTRLSKRKRPGKTQPELTPRLHNWLIRTTRIHAHLCYYVRCFGRPAKDTPGDTVEARAERRDRTLLYDCWAFAIGELLQLQAELSEEMEPEDATRHSPGSQEKVEVMRGRAERLESIFTEGDARLIPRP